MYVRRGVAGITQDIAAAIARQENVSPQYNNPGGLIAAPGCTSRAGQIAICPDAATGQADLERQVQIYIDRGATLSSMLNAWAPASCAGSLCTGNNPSVYTQNVSSWTGIDPSVPLNSLSSASPDAGAGPVLDTSSVSALDLFSSPVDLSSVDWGTALPIAVLVLFGGLILFQR